MDMEWYRGAFYDGGDDDRGRIHPMFIITILPASNIVFFDDNSIVSVAA